MVKVKVEAIGRRIIVLRETPEEVTEGGLIIPREAQRKVEEAVVVTVGEDCKFIKEGDRILIPWGEGTPITIGGQEALVLEEESVQVRFSTK